MAAIDQTHDTSDTSNPSIGTILSEDRDTRKAEISLLSTADLDAQIAESKWLKSLDYNRRVSVDACYAPGDTHDTTHVELSTQTRPTRHQEAPRQLLHMHDQLQGTYIHIV